ncbi:MAG: hypothetical protein H6563_04620 [Lewinellaceae bacterium]|nr:hypothetical protein [Lewinellaceae bacterium]
MRNWKRSSTFWRINGIIAALLLGLLILVPPQPPAADACGPSTQGFKGYAFLNPDYLDTTSAGFPILLRFKDLYSHFIDSTADIQKNDNISEWVSRSCKEAYPADIHRVVYKISIQTLEQFRTSILNKNLPLPYELTNNTFAKYLKRYRCVQTVDYLIFAKKCEPHVVSQGPWEEKKRDVAAMEKLIEEGIDLFKVTDSDNIRLRYAYQIVRLAHYAKLYDRAIELYDYLLPKLDVPIIDGKKSIIFYWTLGHKAGALRALGENVEASYLYSLIFQNCPSRRASAYQSFYLKDDEEWKQCLLMCATDEERATLYAIRGSATNSKALEEMQKIYEINPKNEYMEVLLVKEVQELEKDLLGLDFNNNRLANQRYYKRPRPFAGAYVIELQKFVRQVRQEGLVARPNVWYLAEGYLELLAGDYYAAGKTFEELNGAFKNKALKEQLQVFMLLQQIYALDQLNDSIEQLGYKIRRDKLFSKYKDLPDFLRDKFTALYEENGRPGKAFRSQYSYRDLKMNPKEEVIRDLLKIAEDPDPNNLEMLLLKDEQGNTMTSALWDMWALTLFQDYQLEAALSLYQNIPTAEWDNFGIFHPFRLKIIDCINCPEERDTLDQYNRGELLETLIDLEYKAKAEFDNNAIYYYRIGVALYNCSYFGRSWKAMDYFRSGATWDRLRKGDVQPYGNAPFGNKEVLDVNRALGYLELARANAKNPELAARATFMAAKCERLLYYMSDAYQPLCCNQIPVLPEDFSIYYRRLKSDYAETQFYKQVLRECQYFRAYALK